MKFKGICLVSVVIAMATASGLTTASAVYAQESTAYQINRAHTGYTTFATPLSFPLLEKWAVSFPSNLSYPIIAGGRVFVLSQSMNAVNLYTLDAASGETLWSRNISGMYHWWAALTYGGGRLFVLDDQGVLTALNPLSGAKVWTTQLQVSGQIWLFSSAPTFSNGKIFTAGSGDGGQLYAVKASNGRILWTAYVSNGDNSSPAASDSAVYVSYPCGQVSAFNPNTGAELWRYPAGGDGGGGNTAVLSEGYGLLTRDLFGGNLILDLKKGKLIGMFAATLAPVVVPDRWFAMANGELLSVSRSLGVTQWRFKGDGTLSTAPIVVNDSVFVGGTSGVLYTLDYSGKIVWSTNVGAPILSPPLPAASSPDFTGLAAGEGLIVVPASNKLVAYCNSPALRPRDRKSCGPFESVETNAGLR